MEGEPEAGDIVLAVTHSGEPLAVGFFFNPSSDIAFRLLTYQTHASIDDRFWQDRIYRAMALRRQFIPPETTAYRLINAEGDGIPGLIVDRYSGFLVISIDTAGVEKCRNVILDALCEEVKPSGIYERSDGRARQREGLPNRTELLYGATLPESIEIMENNLVFAVDMVLGSENRFFPGSAGQPRPCRPDQPRGHGAQLLFLHRRFFRLLCPWPGKTSHFRRNIGTCECNGPAKP